MATIAITRETKENKVCVKEKTALADAPLHQVAVIGSGPAGWTASLYLARANLSPLLFEGELDGGAMIPGGQLMTTTEIENYPGFPDGGVSGWEMMEKFKKQGEEFGTVVIPETVVRVSGESGGPFEIRTRSGGVWMVKAIVIATGAVAKYLGLPSEDAFLNRGVSACATCDGALPRFRDKPIVVVGGGDTAMEEALFLARFGKIVHIIHRRDVLRASPIMAKRALEHPKIEVIWDSVVEEVLGEEGTVGVTGVRLKNVKTGEMTVLECSGFFVGIGHKPTSELFLDYVDVDSDGYIITERNADGKISLTKTEGLFACGDVQDKIYRQAVTAAGSGCAAAIDCTRWLEGLE